MKRLLLAIAFVAVASIAQAQTTTVLTPINAATGNTDTTTMSPYPVGSYQGTFTCAKSCDGRIFSTGTSVATTTFYCRIDATSSESWYPCYQVTNPTSTGYYVSLAGSRQYKMAIENYGSGTITFKFFNSSQP